MVSPLLSIFFYLSLHQLPVGGKSHFLAICLDIHIAWLSHKGGPGGGALKLSVIIRLLNVLFRIVIVEYLIRGANLFRK